MFIELVMRCERGLYVEVAGNHSRGAGVLGQYQVGFTQRLHCPGSHVAKVSHRGRHHKQFACAFDFLTHNRNFSYSNAAND